MDISELNPENIVNYFGLDYKLHSGNHGFQINISTCPFCGDSRYKIYMNAESGLGKCFICDTNFNLFSFIKASLNTDSASVFKFLKTNKEAFVNKIHREKKSLVSFEVPDSSKLSSKTFIHDYLKKRNIPSYICEKFNLSYCDYGLYKYTDSFGKTKFVDFSERIIIPIYDILGNFVTFQGRDVTGNSEKKYLFPNMLPSSGRFIYNANTALNNKSKKIVINEGVFDVFSTTIALDSDIRYKDFCAVGSFGKSLSVVSKNCEDQLSDLLKLKENGLEQIIFMWDGSREAIEAQIKAGINLKKSGFNVLSAILPLDKDPNEVDKAVVLAAIDSATPIDSFSLIRFNYAS